MRKYVTDVAGEAINWNGTSYENDYTVAAPNWNVANMRVVAFISRPLMSQSLDDIYVTNAEMEAVNSGSANGITGAKTSAGGVYEVARYTAGGVQLKEPVKGLNIVKLSDGRTMKVSVK